MSYNTQSTEKKYISSPFERNPRCYKEVEKVLKEVKACKGNLKTVLYNSRHRGAFFKKVYSLAENVLKHRLVLEKVIEDIDLLQKEPFLRKEYAGILIYEMILGKGLPGNSKPVVTIKKYENEIREAYSIVKKDGNLCPAGLYSLPRYVRINTLATSVSNVLEDLRNGGFQQMQYDRSTSFDGFLNLVKSLQVGYFLIDFHFKDLLVFAGKENLPGWHLYREGHIFIQDKSSYIPVHALDPKPGCTVIDSCAAPGMKTIHIASVMKNEGQIYAYERDEGRFKILQNMLDSANVNICEAACEDFYLVNTNDPKFRSLEYILVDPSCSGSGMVNRMDSVTDTADSKNTHRLEKLAGFQILLLKHALSFPSVKKVVYSTCSITEEENEFVVHEVLNKFANVFKLVPVMPDWPFRGLDKFEYGHLCLRAYPDKSLTNGFFVAMFERLEGDEYVNSCYLSDGVNHTKSMKNKKASRNHHGDSNINQELPDSFIGKEIDVNQDEGEIECDMNDKEEIKSKRKKDKKKHCSNQVLVLDDETDNITGPSFDSKATDELENSELKKKHKKKKRHSESREILEEKFDNVTENCCEIKTFNDLDTTIKEGRKKKRRHSEHQEVHPEGVLDNVIENSIDFKTTNDLDNTARKQHKKKRYNSKDQEETFEGNFDNVSENPVKIKTNDDLEDNTTKKKHKKKKHEKTFDVAAEASFDKSVSLDTNEDTFSNLENHTETVPAFEEIPIKKRHKKKCKVKKGKDE